MNKSWLLSSHDSFNRSSVGVFDVAESLNAVVHERGDSFWTATRQLRKDFLRVEPFSRFDRFHQLVGANRMEEIFSRDVELVSCFKQTRRDVHDRFHLAL